MNQKEIKKILKGKFSDPSDRQYWINKLAEMNRLERNHRETVANMKAYEKGVSAYKKGKK